MADQPETPESLAGKTPAPVVPSARAGRSSRGTTARTAPARKKAAPKKSAAKKTGAKKTGTKKSPAKKAAAKKSTAKKAPTKKAPTKKAAPKKAASRKATAPARKSAAKKASAKKSPAKKAASTKAAPKKAPAAAAPPAEQDLPTRSPGTVVAPIGDSEVPVVREVPTPSGGGAPSAAEPRPARPPATRRPSAPAEPDDQPLRSGPRRNDRWAVCASITEELLNELVVGMVGDGVELEPLDTSVVLPGMGEVDLRLTLTVKGGRFQLRSEDGGRARVVVNADGEVQTRASAYDGAVQQSDSLGTPMGVPAPPAPIPVRVEALVHPYVELNADDTVSFGLDLAEAELVSLEADPEAPVPDGVDPTSWAGVLQVFGMMFGMLGHGLFASLAEHVGTVGAELGPEVGSALVELGVDPGRADLSIGSGLMSFGLAATERVRGRAQPVPIAGRRIGIGLASSVVDHLTQKLLERAAGEVPLPFEVDLDLGEQRVEGRLRQTRLLPDPFPDLRSSLRTEVRPRLVRGRLELSVQSAWVELPPLVPSFVNTVSQRLGELVSLAPIRMQLPARIEVPLIPGSPDPIPVEIDDLRVTTSGLGVVVALV